VEQAGLATQRKVVQVELGAKFVCWWNCEIGLCEIGGRVWVGAASFFSSFFKHKKRFFFFFLDLCVSY
jgi:hypothetical protein